MNTYKHLLVIVLLFIIVPTLEAAPTLSFEYGPDEKPIAGVKLTQTESDGTITIYASNAAGEVTLTTTTLTPSPPLSLRPALIRSQSKTLSTSSNTSSSCEPLIPIKLKPLILMVTVILPSKML